MSNQSDSFWEHVDALRATLIRILLTIGAGMLLALLFYQPLFDTLLSPLEKGVLKTEEISTYRITNTTTTPQHYTLNGTEKILKQQNVKIHNINILEIAPKGTLTLSRSTKPLAVFSPAEGLMTVLKVSFWVAMVGTSPIWLFWIYLFITPALHRSEKKLFIPFALLSIALSTLGIFFAYSITIPLANNYLNNFNGEIGNNMWGLAHYLNYTTILLLSNALAFETAVVILFLVHFGWITDKGMRKHRAPVYIGIFIMSALLTPPDVLTQVMLALPLIGFYELGILYARIKRRTNSQKQIIESI